MWYNECVLFAPLEWFVTEQSLRKLKPLNYCPSPVCRFVFSCDTSHESHDYDENSVIQFLVILQYGALRTEEVGRFSGIIS